MERAYHHNTRVMLLDTGSTKKTEAYGHMALYHLRKQLAECLVTSKLDYASVVFDPLPPCHLRCLQRVQNACARFVLRKYANESDLVTLNLLDIARRCKLSVLKLSFKSLNDTNFPEYLRLSTQTVSAYNLLEILCCSTIMYPQRIWHLSGHCCNFFQQSANPCQKH